MFTFFLRAYFGDTKGNVIVNFIDPTLICLCDKLIGNTNISKYKDGTTVILFKIII